MTDSVGQVAIIKATPEEDRIKKYVIAGVETLALMLKEIMKNIMEGRLEYDSIIEFKTEVINLYFYYARPKIPPTVATQSKEDKKTKGYEQLYALDYYMMNPQEFELEHAIFYAQKIRELFEDLGLFQLESVSKGQ